MVRNSFTADDSKSKHIMDWAGRVKNLIGTFDKTSAAHNNPNIGQLTRATGYSNLLAACGVESGDVNDQTKPTGTGYDLPTDQTTNPTAKQLDKKDSECGGLQTKQQRVSFRGDDEQPRRTADTQEARRAASFSQHHGGDYPDTAEKPVARRASQTEVKPTTMTAARDSSRSAEPRRSSIRDRPTPERATLRYGSREPSSDSDAQHQPAQVRLAARGSREMLPTEQKDDEDDDDDTQDKRSTTNSTSHAPASTGNLSYDDKGKKPTAPTIRRKTRSLNAEGRPQRSPTRMSTSQPIGVDEKDSNESLSYSSPTTRNKSQRLNATKARLLRSPEKIPTSEDSNESLYDTRLRSTNRDEVASADNDEMATQRGRRSIPDHDWRQRAAERRLQKRYQKEHQRLPEPKFDAGEKDSDKCSSVRNDDLDMRQRSDYYPSERRLQRDLPPPQRGPRAATKPTCSTSPPRYRERNVEPLQYEARMPPRRIFTDSNESLNSEPERLASDVDVGQQQRARMMLRAHSPPQRLVDVLPPTDVARRDYDYQDLAERREPNETLESSERRGQSVSPGRSRRRRVPSHELASYTPQPEAVTSVPAATSSSPDRGRKSLRTTSSGLPSPRPILRKTSPSAAGFHAVKDNSPTAEKKTKKKKATSPDQASSVHSKPGGVPLRRAAANTDVVDDDIDNDYLLNVAVKRPPGGRGLGKCSAVTDLSDRLDLTPIKRALVSPPRAPIKPSSVSLSPRGSAVTPRRVWVWIRPVLMTIHHLLTWLLAYARHELRELFRRPQVVEARNRVYVSWLRVLEDWALFLTVIFTVVGFFLVILLC